MSPACMPPVTSALECDAGPPPRHTSGRDSLLYMIRRIGTHKDREIYRPGPSRGKGKYGSAQQGAGKSRGQRDRGAEGSMM